jgi:transcriptional regulator with XRE-family HTH domain
MTQNINRQIDVKQLGRRIKAQRETRNLTLKMLGEAVGVHYTQISRIERGDSVLMSKNLQKICNYLGLSTTFECPTTQSQELKQKLEMLVRTWPQSEPLLWNILDSVQAAFDAKKFEM